MLNREEELRFCKARRAAIALDYQNLNPEQRRAALATDGPLLLLAGAGSGKTTVLIHRIANLMKYGRGSDCDEAPAWAAPADLAFLEGYGWIVSQEPAAVEDIRLPDTCDASYDEYLSLQKSQGFDLSQYAGKTVKRYTYQVSNYPGLQENIWASLLLYKKEVIGGEIYSNEGDGFIQALPYPAKT